VPKIFRYIGSSLWPDDPSIRHQRFHLSLSGVLLAASWPPLPLGFLAFIALIRPLDIISGKPFGKAFKSGYLFSFVYYLFSLYWIGWVTIPGTLAAMAIISLYSAFIFALYACVYRFNRMIAMILFPLLWIGMEYFRTLLEIAFPWSNLSYTQGSYTPFLQICEYVGDLGISLIIVIVNILLWRAWRRHRRLRKAVLVLIAGLLVAIPTVYGTIILSNAGPVNSGSIHVALLQGDIDLETKWDPNKKDYNFAVYDSLSKAAAPADLLVWPETAAPAYLLGNHLLAGKVSATAREVECPMLVGMLDFNYIDDSTVETFNAAVQFDPSGRFRKPFHKNKLVPFAETVPYGHYIPWLANLSMGWSDFEHGRELRIYDNEFGSYGTLICYEVIFPEIINKYVSDGADFLVNITNDTWYGYSSGPFQHAGMPAFRAIENRLWIARAANSGFSFFVDKYGRVYNKSRLYERVIMHGMVSPVEGRTFFNRTGPVIGKLGLLLIGIVSCILLTSWIRHAVKN
jgi:apolipoprotein N-acyltransferase